MKLHALELSLTIGCRLDCLYCPQKLLLSKYYGTDKGRKSKLSFQDFKTVLEKVQEGAGISFCGMSEPFHNEECADMIAYAYEKGYKISLNTTLVGMRKEDFEKIKNVRFDSFILHIPDKEGNAKFPITEEYLSLLRLVEENINVNYYSCHGTVSDAVTEIINPAKYAGIALGDRAGNLDGVSHISKMGGVITCYHGSESQISGWIPVMFPDGSLVLCCMDYGMKHVLGNLIIQSWDEIMEGEEYRKFAEGLKNDSVDILCRKCGDAREVSRLPAMELRRAVSEQGRDSTVDVVRRLAEADSVCVFGLGKLWRDHYYQEHWNEGLHTVLFSDNNEKVQNTVINGVPCVKPEELLKYENPLVVIFVKNGVAAIMEQFRGLGILNCIAIEDVFAQCAALCEEKDRRDMSS